MKCFFSGVYIPILLTFAFLHSQEINITQTPLDQLLKIKVISVSKKKEDVETVPASVYVLTQKQIAASGATTLPELLRLVPGIQVAKVDASKWAIGIRGMGSRTTQNLLVMRDGRSLYDPLFSGTFWEIEDYNLDDIDHIEVVRGPGGAVWGANAVNGVINIITKSSQDTQGMRLDFGAGKEEKGFANFRVGTKLGSHFNARAYGKYTKTDAGYRPSNPQDSWKFQQMGFRMDKQKNNAQFRVSGDYYRGEIGENNSSGPFTANHEGGNILFNTALKRGNSEYFFNSYYDYRFLDHLTIDEERHSYDLEFRQQTKLFKTHSVHWGLEYRASRDRIPVETNPASPPEYRADVKPRERLDHLYQLFLQDDIAIVPKFHLILGSKLEYNSYTDWEIQPSIRAQYLLHRSHTIWSAFSRAVRVPSRLESDIHYGDVQAGKNFVSENLLASELGYRFSGRKWTLDLSGFYNNYQDMLSQESNNNGIPLFENKLEGSGWGGELSINWQVFQKLNSLISYSYLDLDFNLRPGSSDTSRAERLEEASPKHQAGWQVLYQPDSRWNLGAFLRYVGEIKQWLNGQPERVKAYAELNLSLSYTPIPELTVSLAGTNLLQEHHPEQKTSGSSEVERSAHVKVTLCF